MKIAISGKQGAGKTTLAMELVEQHGFTKRSFADGVKDTGMHVFGLSHEEAYGKQKSRELLQAIGQKMREIDPLVWVKMLERQLDDSDEHVVIDDMRFKNEFDLLKANGFVMLRVETAEENRKERIPHFGNPDDISEIDLDDIASPFDSQENRYWDVIINNDNVSIERFRGSASKIVRVFKETPDN